MNEMAKHTITSAAELRALYGAPNHRAVGKCLDRLDRHCRRIIAAAPFLAISSQGAGGGADVSPKGDPPGFVHVLDDTTLLIPDRPGNRRVDTMLNILENPHVGLLFLVPGMNETLRVNGRATITTDPALLAPMAVNGRLLVAAIRVEVVEAFLHCAKALIRSRLWDPSRHIDRASLPSHAEMLCDHIGDPDVEAAEAAVADSIRERLY